MFNSSADEESSELVASDTTLLEECLPDFFIGEGSGEDWANRLRPLENKA
jgi:hypothetical protein